MAIEQSLDGMGPSIDSIVNKAVGLPAPAEGKAAPEVAAPPQHEEQPVVEVEAEAPEQAAAELDTEPEGAQDPEEKSPAPAAKKQQGSDELRRAREAAIRAGLPESDVKSLSEAGLLAYAKAKAKNDRDVQRTFQENAELRRQVEEAKKAAPAEEAPKGPAPVEELDPQLVEELGEQGARAIASLVAKRVAEQVAEAKAQAAEATAQERKARSIFDAMQEAGEFGPGLPETGAYEQVLEKATALSLAEGLYQGLQGEDRARAIFKDASRLIADPQTPSSPEPEDKEPPAQTATVTRVPQRTTRTKPVDTAPDAAVDRMIGAVLRGSRNPAEIARKYG